MDTFLWMLAAMRDRAAMDSPWLPVVISTVDSRRIVFQLVNVNERSVGNIDISQLTGNINDRYHAAAFHYYLLPYL